MALKIPALGENALLKDMLGVTTPGDLSIRLFTNDITPSDADTTATYTEMTGHGYVAKTVAPAGWTVSQNADVAEAVAAAQTWVFSAGPAVSVYGYYVVGADGVLRWAERFATTFSAEFLNDSIVLTPKFTLSTT